MKQVFAGVLSRATSIPTKKESVVFYRFRSQTELETIFSNALESTSKLIDSSGVSLEGPKRHYLKQQHFVLYKTNTHLAASALEPVCSLEEDRAHPDNISPTAVRKVLVEKRFSKTKV